MNKMQKSAKFWTLFLIIFISLLTSDIYSIKKSTWDYANTTGDGLIVRKKPDTKSKCLDKLKLNTLVKILGRSDSKMKIGKAYEFWYKIKTEDGLQGWVYGEYLKESNKKFKNIASKKKSEIQPKNVEIINTDFATVTTNKLSLRKSPDSSSKILAYLSEDDIIEITKQSKNIDKIGKYSNYWYKIKTSKGLTGWTYGEYLAPIKINVTPLPTPGYASIDEDGLALRSAPSSDAKLIDRLNKKDPVQLVKRSNKIENINNKKQFWYKVKTPDGTTGWTFGAYLEVTTKKNYKKAVAKASTKNIITGLNKNRTTIYSYIPVHNLYFWEWQTYDTNIRMYSLKKVRFMGDNSYFCAVVVRNDDTEIDTSYCMYTAYGNKLNNKKVSTSTNNGYELNLIPIASPLTVGNTWEVGNGVNAKIVDTDIKIQIGEREFDKCLVVANYMKLNKDDENSAIHCCYKYYAKDIGLVAEKEFIASNEESILPHDKITILSKWLVNYGDPKELISGTWIRDDNNYKRKLIFKQNGLVEKEISFYNKESNQTEIIISEKGKYTLEKDVVKMNFTTPPETMSEYPIPYSEELTLEFPENERSLYLSELSGRSYKKLHSN